jgi:toxin YoeB
MEVIYKDKAIEDIKFWKKSGQKNIQDRITKLIDDIQLHPKTGIGKPELLKHSR